MNCKRCGSQMRLVRRADSEAGQTEWYRCSTCDSGQMRSLPRSRTHRAVPDDLPDSSLGGEGNLTERGKRLIDALRKRR